MDVEAEKSEHVISEELADRVEEAPGYPKTDPHGDPIPTIGGGGLEEVLYDSLADLEVGQTVVIRRVSDDSSEMLCYITSLGIHPGAIIHLRKKGAFRDPLFIQVDSDEHIIGQEVAGKIFAAPYGK